MKGGRTRSAGSARFASAEPLLVCPPRRISRRNAGALSVPHAGLQAMTRNVRREAPGVHAAA
jgi:hypothetical protein